METEGRNFFFYFKKEKKSIEIYLREYLRHHHKNHINVNSSIWQEVDKYK